MKMCEEIWSDHDNKPDDINFICEANSMVVLRMMTGLGVGNCAIQYTIVG